MHGKNPYHMFVAICLPPLMLFHILRSSINSVDVGASKEYLCGYVVCMES